MAFVMKIVGSIVAPLLLFYIGWQGIEPAKRKGALRVIFIMFGVSIAGTSIYILIMIQMTPKWRAQACMAAYEEITQSDLAKEPTLAREPFLSGCNRLSVGAAECTRPSHSRKFAESCGRYVDEIHAILPKLDLGISKLSNK